MLDNQQMLNIIAALNTGLVSINAGLITAKQKNILVKSNFQPTQQGANTGPTLYVHKLHDHRYGYRGVRNDYDQATDTFIKTEVQYLLTEYQVTGLSIQDPKDISTMTAGDITNIAAMIMAQEETLTAFRAVGLGILRITDVRSPTMQNDKGRFEFSPSFDFTLTHDQSIISTSPVVRSYEFDLKRV